ncbi:DoxX family protein [Haliea sp.]
MNTIIYRLHKFNEIVAYPAEPLQNIALLVLRLYASWIFFPAGLQKTRDWGSTLFLFEEEYRGPLLSPELAAWLGTFGELVFPVLLTLGLLSRVSAAGLFVVNAVAVMSLEVIAPVAMADHVLWGAALLVIIVWGHGKISLDYFMTRWLECRSPRNV